MRNEHGNKVAVIRRPCFVENDLDFRCAPPLTVGLPAKRCQQRESITIDL